MAVRTALVGFGYAGQTFHAPLIMATPGLELAAIVSGNPEKVAAVLPSVQVRDLDTVLSDPSIDLIVIATPNDTHAPLAARSLAVGKHVVVDKPFTVNLSDARTLAEQARISRQVLSIFHNRRWDADYLTLSSLIRQGALGRITQFESHFDRFRPVPRDRWRERAGVPGAGLWFDLGPHLIDQALCLFGRPQSIQADIDTQRAGKGAPDYFHAILRYRDGLRVILHGSMLTVDAGLRFAVHGDAGSYIKHGLDVQEDQMKAGRRPGDGDWGVDPSPAQVMRMVDGAAVANSCAGQPGDYRRYYAAVRDAIADSGRNPVTADEAVSVIELIDLGARSATEQRVLDVPQLQHGQNYFP